MPNAPEHPPFCATDRTPYSKMYVNGSFVHNAFWVLRTPQTGRTLRVSFLGHRPHIATVKSENNVLYRVNEGTAPIEVEGITLSFSGRKRFQVQTAEWRMTAESTISYPHANIMRLNIQVASLYRVCAGRMAPHGILGQTFDCDGTAVHGKQDSYETLDSKEATRRRRGAGGIVTTKAQGEGALEGKYSDYMLNAKFDTAFTFSAFNSSWATRAAPRDAHKLAGMKASSRSKIVAATMVTGQHQPHRELSSSCSCIPSPPALPPSLLPSSPPASAWMNGGVWAFSFDSSAAVLDNSGTGGVASYYNPVPVYTASGKTGGGLVFDGVDDAIQIDTGFTTPTAGWTACLWIKMAAHNAFNGRSYIIDFRYGGGSACWFLDSDDTMKLNLESVSFSWVPALDVWEHWCVVSPASSAVKVYRDGAVAYTSSGTGSSATAKGNAVVGTLYSYFRTAALGNYFMNATIDSLYFAHTALMDYQVHQLFLLSG
jgi:hypothetical protein